MATAATSAQIRDFLSSRRARVTPQQAGLPDDDGGSRRVAGLRREEVAVLAGVSVDYYVRMERGHLAGASDGVLDGLARALQLDDAEREHLAALARESGPGAARRRRRAPAGVTPGVQRLLDAVTDAPAWVRNGRFDVLAMNPLARALYSPVLESDPRRPANTARFIHLHPEAAAQFFVDHERVAADSAAMLRLEAARNPHDEAMAALVGELSIRSEQFRRAWASHDVLLHRSGTKRLQHPAVGRLDLDYEALQLTSAPGLQMNTYTAPAGSPSADALRLLASWAATTQLPELVRNG